MRFVVFREYMGLSVWYVEAPTREDAIERVLPTDPFADEYFLETGGIEDPHLEAVLTELRLRTHSLRRFPANVSVATGAHEHRRIGPEGDPPRRRPR